MKLQFMIAIKQIKHLQRKTEEKFRSKFLKVIALTLNNWHLKQCISNNVIKDENIGNHGYIGTSILWIYRIYRRYIGGYWKKILVDLKLLKTHKNARKTS